MEILFTEIVKIGVGPLFWLFIGLALIFGIAAILIDLEHPLLVTFLIIITIASVILTICFGASQIGAKEETRYHVTIDDSVSMIEFSENYEIIEQKDKIFIIKEKG